MAPHKSKKRSSRTKSIESYCVPFDIKCEECCSVIGEGVTVDAKRKQLGTSHTKKSWSFTFKCCCCGAKIVVHYEAVKGDKKSAATPERKPPGVLDLVEQICREQPLDVMSINERRARARLKAILFDEPFHDILWCNNEQWEDLDVWG